MVVKVAGLSYPKHISEEVDLLARALGGAVNVYLFVDYGGTLVEGPSHENDYPEEDVLVKLEHLSCEDAFDVFVISGRTVDELDERLRLDNVNLVGQRGLEIKRVYGSIEHPVDPKLLGSLMHHIELDAHRCLGSYPGVVVENRGFALTLRLLCKDPKDASDAVKGFVGVVRELDTHGQLEILYGDDRVEARMAGWHKGDAVNYILQEADPEETLVIYVGDDVTDEDAFEAVLEWSDEGESGMPWFMVDGDEEEARVPHALPILVAEHARPTTASLFVRNPQEVYELLSSLAAIASALL